MYTVTDTTERGTAMIEPRMAPLGRPKRRFTVIPQTEPATTPVHEPAPSEPVKTPEREPVPA